MNELWKMTGRFPKLLILDMVAPKHSGPKGANPNPTGRAKAETNRGIRKEANGGPLNVVISRAKIQPKFCGQPGGVVIERPLLTQQSPQYL